jgi:hypothetical protein
VSAREDDRVRTVYIYVLRGQRSGGLEALHQLAHELMALGVEARLVASPESRGLPEEPAYAGYGCTYAEAIPDSPSSVVVVPEIAISVLADYPRSRKAIWWLSVDFGEPYNDHPWTSTERLRALIRDSHHCAQSEYARVEIARRERVTLQMLSDYTVFSGGAAHGSDDGPGSVAYNALRGGELTDLVRAKATHLAWRPIENLSRSGVDDLLRRTTVYLDLGSHPGKDRIPREAALAGCVVVVGRTGSAAYDEDVPLAGDHKVDLDRAADEVANDVAARLDRIVADPAPHREAQRGYVDRIRREREVFRQEVEAFVEALVSWP